MVDSSPMFRISLHLTSNDTKDSELDAWLSKASFWAQIFHFSLIFFYMYNFDRLIYLSVYVFMHLFDHICEGGSNCCQ
jgi:hypothetical protein